MIGHDHRKWLSELWRVFKIKQEPITTKTGEVIAEPIFWFTSPQNGSFACFGQTKPSQRIAKRLEDFGVSLLEVGKTV